MLLKMYILNYLTTLWRFPLFISNHSQLLIHIPDSSAIKCLPALLIFFLLPYFLNTSHSSLHFLLGISNTRLGSSYTYFEDHRPIIVIFLAFKLSLIPNLLLTINAVTRSFLSFTASITCAIILQTTSSCPITQGLQTPFSNSNQIKIY